MFDFVTDGTAVVQWLGGVIGQRGRALPPELMAARKGRAGWPDALRGNDAQGVTLGWMACLSDRSAAAEAVGRGGCDAGARRQRRRQGGRSTARSRSRRSMTPMMGVIGWCCGSRAGGVRGHRGRGGRGRGSAVRRLEMKIEAGTEVEELRIEELGEERV